jgi:hypothetical protein
MTSVRPPLPDVSSTIDLNSVFIGKFQDHKGRMYVLSHEYKFHQVDSKMNPVQEMTVRGIIKRKIASNALAKLKQANTFVELCKMIHEQSPLVQVVLLHKPRNNKWYYVARKVGRTKLPGGFSYSQRDFESPKKNSFLGWRAAEKIETKGNANISLFSTVAYQNNVRNSGIKDKDQLTSTRALLLHASTKEVEKHQQKRGRKHKRKRKRQKSLDALDDEFGLNQLAYDCRSNVLDQLKSPVSSPFRKIRKTTFATPAPKRITPKLITSQTPNGAGVVTNMSFVNLGGSLGSLSIMHTPARPMGSLSVMQTPARPMGYLSVMQTPNSCTNSFPWTPLTFSKSAVNKMF